MMKYLNTLTPCLFCILTACVPTPQDVIEATEPLTVYPDYQDVTLPCNLAPLNFMLRGDYDALQVQISAGGETLLTLNRRGPKAVFDTELWHQMLTEHTGSRLQVDITARTEGRWWHFAPLRWTISTDSIDAYVTYRLIEPGYEVWDKVCIEERCLEDFTTRLLANGEALGNRCLNCHTHGGDRGQYAFFHLRGADGGTIVSRNGTLRKVTLRNERMKAGAVYGDWHPSGRYAVFSTNVIIPSFHSFGSRRLEVYDTQSDLCVADFDQNRMLLAPADESTSKASKLETFPCFSADGRWIYYCVADNPCGDTIPQAIDLRNEVEQLHYSLCRTAFDAETGQFGAETDTIYNAHIEGGSMSFPKCSADGRMVCATHSDYGTFPIWHREARLSFYYNGRWSTPADLHATYHSWSHNSRWIAFASKRTDGQYGRINLVHIKTEGDSVTMSRPLILPQSDPEADDWNTRSYNLPDLSSLPAAFGTENVEVMLKNVSSEVFK